MTFSLLAQGRASAAFLSIALIASSAAAQIGGADGPRGVIPWLEESASGEAAAGSIGATPKALPPATAEPNGGVPTTGGPARTPPLRLDLDPAGGGESSSAQPGVVGRTSPSGLPAAGAGAGIEVASLRKVDDGAAGLIAAKDMGLSIAAWAATSEKRAAALARAFRPSGLRQVNRFAIRLLLTAFEPPQADPTGPTDKPDLLAARMDALMRFGAADAATRLAESAGGHRLARAAAPALTAGLEEIFCRAILDPSEPASLPRIYCQILAGDEAGALLALDASRALGETDTVTLGLLEAMAEPELVDLAQPPKAISELTPLRLAAMRKLGIAPPSDFARTAPLTLLQAAFGLELAPRQRLVALERLEQSGALPTEQLAEAYRAADSAESGGVWGRVEAFKRAIGAPFPQLPSRAKAALAKADESGKRAMMARLLGPSLARYAQDSLANGSAAAGRAGWTEELRDALRLAGHGDLAAQLLRAGSVRPSAEELMRDRLAAPSYYDAWDAEITKPLLARAVRGDQAAGRILAALDVFGAPIADPSLFTRDPNLVQLAPGRAAETAFEAIALLTKTEEVSPEALHGALSRLIALGLTEQARMIAIEAVLASN